MSYGGRTIPAGEARMRSELTWVAVGAAGEATSIGLWFLVEELRREPHECLALPWPSFRRRALPSTTPPLGGRLLLARQPRAWRSRYQLGCSASSWSQQS